VENDGFFNMTVYVAVDRFSAPVSHIPQSKTTKLEFSLMLFDLGAKPIDVPAIDDLGSAFGGPTIFGHPQSPGVVAVAACPWWESPSFNPGFPPTPDIDPQFYTSRGGLMTQFFDPAGKFMMSLS